jgi:outer membrane protein OmpA-like peptidoglycan-associated protein
MKLVVNPALLLLAGLLAACSSAPTSTSLLDQTRSDYYTAQHNPHVTSYASAEMDQAAVLLDKANSAANDHESAEKIDKLAYLAKQKIATATEISKQKTAEAVVAHSAQERNQVRLNERTNEANLANANAQQANAATKIAQDQTQQAQAQTARLQAQLNELSARQTDRGMLITINDVLFNTDKAQLKAEGVMSVQKVARILLDNPQQNVYIDGFTDSTGSAAHNLEISERRANSVSAVLIDMGITRNRITTHGYGEDQPVADNATAQNRQLNRRVEITLYNPAKNTVHQ